MKSLQDRSIRQKITLVIMLIVGVVLCVACCVLFAFQAWRIKMRFMSELAVTGEMVASNLAVAAMFNDEERAAQVLEGLKAMPQIVGARLHRNDGTRLAEFGGSGTGDESVIPPPDAGVHVEGHRILLEQPVMRDGQRHGTLYLDADFESAYLGLMQTYGGMLVAVLLTSLVLALFLSGRLQHLVTAPILQLAGTARQIAVGKDYSVRAAKAGSDEVGTLTDAFNQMLAQIHSQDTALQTAQQELQEQLAALEREIAGRKLAQAAQEKLIAINEATPDFVGTTDLTGRISYLNRAARLLVGLGDDVDHGSLSMLEIQPAWAARIVADEGLPCAIRDGSWAGETAVLHRDGREIHVSQVIIAHKNVSGEVESFSTVVRDVSERKAAEEALRRSQEKLLESSRLAGKAEVATSVLHNVGNVLNSVNVSGNVLNDRLRSSKVAALARTVELIKEHHDDFSGFVTHDPRGRRFPELICKISDALLEEQKELLAEVGAISSHISHIKEIVAMQQSFSRAGGVIEHIDAEDLVEDALRMNAAALTRHHIKVVHEYEPVPKVLVDRHKVLQILINLLSNAKHAVEESGREDKLMTVKIQPNGGHYVKISVQDNGIGIAPKNLTRIFAHGFTTKRAGHGFGLHSGALAATELGGTLRVHSDGPGTGATFTLELPILAPSTSRRPSDSTPSPS